MTPHTTISRPTTTSRQRSPNAAPNSPRVQAQLSWAEVAQELVVQVRRNATVDWSVRESARARMRLAVKKLLRRYKYPPDKQEKATQTVLEQADLLGDEPTS
jgi:Type I restriction enzyme HindI endonuclease subunit-like, C-terminal